MKVEITTYVRVKLSKIVDMTEQELKHYKEICQNGNESACNQIAHDYDLNTLEDWFEQDEYEETSFIVKQK